VFFFYVAIEKYYIIFHDEKRASTPGVVVAGRTDSIQDAQTNRESAGRMPTSVLLKGGRPGNREGERSTADSDLRCSGAFVCRPSEGDQQV